MMWRVTLHLVFVFLFSNVIGSLQERYCFISLSVCLCDTFQPCKILVDRCSHFFASFFETDGLKQNQGRLFEDLL